MLPLLLPFLFLLPRPLCAAEAAPALGPDPAQAPAATCPSEALRVANLELLTGLDVAAGEEANMRQAAVAVGSPIEGHSDVWAARVVDEGGDVADPRRVDAEGYRTGGGGGGAGLCACSLGAICCRCSRNSCNCGYGTFAFV